MTSFVPRPVYRVKGYVYPVEEGDTPSLIAMKFRQPPGAYAELVGANLNGRQLMPMPLSSRFGAMTFRHMSVGEPLAIPASWPDPPSAATLGDVLEDMSSSLLVDAFEAVWTTTSAQQSLDALGLGDFAPTVFNAAVQWWVNTKGTDPPDPADPLLRKYLLSATLWTKYFAVPLAQQGMSLDRLARFPWGPFLAMLPQPIQPETQHWPDGPIPGAKGALWKQVPWMDVVRATSVLTAAKPVPIQWPASPDDASVADAIKAALQQAADSISPSPPGGRPPTPAPDGQAPPVLTPPAPDSTTTPSTSGSKSSGAGWVAAAGVLAVLGLGALALSSTSTEGA